MTKSVKKLIEMETQFWQSAVAEDTNTALLLLHKPALIASSHGTVEFDHAGLPKDG